MGEEFSVGVHTLTVCVMMGLQKFPESKLVLLLQLLEVVDAFL
jgi:hypothetical protein